MVGSVEIGSVISEEVKALNPSALAGVVRWSLHVASRAGTVLRAHPSKLVGTVEISAVFGQEL